MWGDPGIAFAGRVPYWAPDPESLFMAGMDETRANAPETIVRDAALADAPAIARIGKVAIPDTYRDLIADESVLSAIVAQSYAVDALERCIDLCARKTTAEFLVAAQGNSIVGFLHYDCEGPEPALHRIYVDPALKRHGIGSALIRELHRRLVAGASYTLMVVAANRPAISFYERHGLVEAARLDGVAYMQARMGVAFPPETPQVPALILRFEV